VLVPLIRVLSLAGPAPAVRLLLLLPRLGVFVPAGREHTAPPGGTCPGLGPRALSGTLYNVLSGNPRIFGVRVGAQATERGGRWLPL
jgi:hypothetical protein